MSDSSPPSSPRHLDSLDSEDSGYASACHTEDCASEARSPSPMLVDSPSASSDLSLSDELAELEIRAAVGLTAEEAEALLDDVKRVSCILNALPEDDMRAVLQAAQPLEEGFAAGGSQMLVQDQVLCSGNPSSTHSASDIPSDTPFSVICLNYHVISALLSCVGVDDDTKKAWCESVGVVYGRELTDEEDQLCTLVEQNSGLTISSHNRSIMAQYFMLMGNTLDEILTQHESDGGRNCTWCNPPK